MNEKQRILIVHNNYQIPGGEDTVVANEMEMLQENGHEITLYTRNNNELKSMSKFKKLLLPFTTIFNLKTYRDIKKIIKEKRIEIVHVHNTLNLISPSVYYAALSCGVLVVQTVHNFRLLCPGATFYRDGHICEDCLTKGLGCAIKHKCYRDSTFQTLACVINTKIHRLTGVYGKINYICLTEFNRQKLLNLKHIDANKVYVKPNFVKSNGVFISSEKRLNQFVFAGRLDKLKGIDFLLDAWSNLGAIAPKLIVCGTGPMEKWCREFVVTHACNVELKGYVPNDVTRDIIARSKAVILPTRLYEGFPMSVVEAFSVGTPVICSDLGNCGRLVEHGVTGWKFKDRKSLIACIFKAEEFNNYYNIFRYYKMNYEASTNYKKLSEIYSNLC